MHYFKRVFILFIPIFMILISCPVGIVFADDVIDSINEAVEYYKEKDYLEAKNSLQYATELLGQLRTEQLQKFLPEPLKGWKAEEVQAQNVGASMFGGMSSVMREYRRDDSYVKIEIMADSPMIQGMMAMFSNPAYATADGGKLTKIKRQKAVIKYKKSNMNGDITIVVAKKYFVKLEGRNSTEQELIDYASTIDFKGLKDF